MSTALAMAPSPAPHDRPSFGADLPAPSAAAAASMAATATATVASLLSPSAQRTTSGHSSGGSPYSSPPNAAASRSGSGSPKPVQASSSKPSPPSATRNGTNAPPKIIVKKEPGSPDLPTARHRPRRLDLSKNTNSSSANPGTSRPLTSRESGGLGIQEVGIACLSPGFVAKDPLMQQQVERSMSVREQQRHIIEARLQQQSAKGDGVEGPKDKDSFAFAAKTPGMSRRNKAPPGLSIVAPSHEQFANERVIQSAPLGQTFTGRYNPHPLTRHITNQPSNLGGTTHIHAPGSQLVNRLPPIADVIGPDPRLSGHPESSGHALYASQSGRGPLTSPGHPPAPTPGRRDYRSAEEAQAELAGGRTELLPKLVHYGGHQPPTPPSPLLGAGRHPDSRSTSRRRNRAEYEEGGSPPLGNGRAATRRGPFGEGRDSPETQRQKRDEFLRICERAWDLFHS